MRCNIIKLNVCVWIRIYEIKSWQRIVVFRNMAIFPYIVLFNIPKTYWITYSSLWPGSVRLSLNSEPNFDGAQQNEVAIELNRCQQRTNIFKWQKCFAYNIQCFGNIVSIYIYYVYIWYMELKVPFESLTGISVKSSIPAR